ncbi:hypothetical protein ABW21_db0208439 [Orbilia brochopaga]|nr:hypothetical protein ABW21_db0208439 [Drechslerella brochopaga]
MSDITTTGDTQPQPKRRRITEKRRAQNREAQRLFRERKRKKIFESLSHPVEEDDVGHHADQVAASTEAAQTNRETSSTVSPEPYGPSASGYLVDETLAANVLNVPPLVGNSDRLDEINDLARRIYDADYVANRKRGTARQLVSLHWLLNDPNDPVPPNLLPGDSGAVTNEYSTSVDDTATQESLLPFENEGDVGRSEVLPNVTASCDVSVSDSFPLISEIEISHELSVPFWDLQGQGKALPSSSSLSAIPNSGTFDSTPFEENPYHTWVASGYSMREIIKAGLEALTAKNRQLDFRIPSQERQEDHCREVWENEVIAATEKHYLQELLFKPSSPLGKTIVLEQISVARAILINTEVIGLHDLWPEDFKDNFKSPFVQSYFLHEQSIEAVKNKFSHLGISLRPSEAQCTTPHKVIIDALPFRGIKDKMMSAITEGWNLSEFNELEFCEDMGRGALICWGSGQGAYGGQPWNPKSWEAKSWFLEKWSHIIDDELKESSRWWRRLREEDVEELE